ncbi:MULTISPECIES: p-hydroxyphenylacetate 3-hydroxylase reductase component [unclassified Pseudomonas]|uniref:p-hydroxyphenylacetate 3-hydroxylase reductase component n=1 Tax=unclassified Pseudomonas TaxID=196821 RepID=UPI000A0A8916|nr:MULTISPECIES: flavin reductase [unclassified Pseudomonas]SMF24831.1 NADH-FMN oxidoreductase RutF, flavin reductase (DIM6/NTAB) family [Pseudomonas sp. LAIL14HWK12:I11]SMR74169.1 NADH-FMN oxidoreductase RutF, flavin reductase (DIM6/NTAB) family [Pseudomonas sp. LAIL14HWK12:I10]SOD03730.1 NADH-FMN oxidoreductase RutF, flavin reductase (DIM6/NTAB) family [Pseudomonas sp. LAIL14HWK12:I8]
MSTENTTAFDSRAFRRALGNFATGVTVVTAAGASGRKVGVTANSFNSVSLEPALILWSIDKRSTSHEVFEEASHFAVNILAADQIELSNNFARPKDDRFAGIDYQQGAGGAPLLADCSARFQCEKFQQLDGGDHWILVGKVVAFDDFGRSPLLYHQGAYSMVLPHTRMTQRAEGQAPSSHFQGRLQHNLYYLMTQALRAYQGDYQPRQLSTGLRTSEARMLMVLENDAGLSLNDLQREVAMPAREIEEAVANLKRKGLIADDEGRVRLSVKGVDETEALWTIAREQQDKVFGQFSEEQLDTFKTVLKAIIKM